ncbi:exo-alpha-sialidase [Pelagicoccus sp. NFK12]|uniref:beta-galactosidase n=1 Tax=Pelagicoccus enzymogenes TaxID=2773457 RepID=A0A927F9U1_9BACT|nr:exo-alpha-sialidase [Pelagicoccus enzymogenes]MBD5780386.1 exo-alpha-sialidase [Pelagicoccus enzymogenes]
MDISRVFDRGRHWAVAIGMAIAGFSQNLNAVDVPEPLSLDGEWKFKFAEDKKAADEYRWFFEEGYDYSDWDTIPVPSHWSLLGYEDPRWVNGSEAEGFYFKTFVAPENASELRTFLKFDGVWVSTEVWVNGEGMGRHDSGFTAFSYDISGQIKPGEENVIAVRVRQQIEGQLFKFDANDDWALAGIYRSVSIDYKPKELFIERVAVETDLDELFVDADLKLGVFVQRNDKGDYFAPGPPFDVVATLSTLAGEEVAKKSYEASVMGRHNGREVSMSVLVDNPELWTAETPNLYNLKVEVVQDGVVKDSWSDRIGFREVSTDGGVLRINGQAVKLRGVASHDLWPDVGRATTREHWIRDIELMKAANINTVRMAHYPHAEGFVRLCDEYGLYLLDEIPLGFGGDRMGNPIFAAGAYLRIHETIERDRNRPSVIIWDFGNEDPFSALHLTGLKAIKGLDKTRPVLMPFRHSQDLPEEVDILAPHYWTAEAYDKLASEARRPIVSTEYTHAIGPNDFGEMEQRWKALTQHGTGAGAMIWLWANEGLLREVGDREVADPMKDKDKYSRDGGELVLDKYVGRGEKKIIDSHGNYGSDGIVDADRLPQRDYFEAKAVYAPVQVLVEEASLGMGDSFFRVPVNNGYDFLNLSTVSFNWSIYREDDLLDEGTASLYGEPHQTVSLKIPAESVDLSVPGAYYAVVEVRREDGSEMAEYAVRLGGESEAVSDAIVEAGELSVSEKADELVVSTGTVRYAFDRSKGIIESIKVDGVRVVEDSSFTAWRPATFAERNRLDKRKDGYPWESYLGELEAKALSWKVEKGAEGVTLETSVEHRYDEKNVIEVDYRYSIDARGVLDLSYVARPRIDHDWIPEIGVSLKIVDEPANVEWQGLGILDTTPGKTAAARFGQWIAPVFSKEARGHKTQVEWARIALGDGIGFYADGMPAFRLDGVYGEGSKLHLLSNVAGSWVKNGPAEREEWNIPVGSDSAFEGSFRLVPTAKDPEIEAAAEAVIDHPAVLSSQFINESKTYKECHASSIIDLGKGKLLATWFGGTKERNPDVGIWVSRFENGRWGDAVEVANGVQEDGTRHPSWNPVLFQPEGGPIYLFYKVGPNPREWWGLYRTSKNGGKTWSEAVRLEDGFLGPIKNKPVELANGDWLAPSSTEATYDGWRAHFERSRDQGKTWEWIGPIHPGVHGEEIDSIQGSVLDHGDGVLQVLCRTKQGYLSSSWSYDNGETWTPTRATALPNTGSGTDAVTLKDGRHLLIYNHTSGPPERLSKGVRYPIDLAVSSDGVNWDRVMTLETEPRGAGYAYPAIIEGKDGRIHITYTWNRELIKHVVLDADKL